MKVWIGLWLIAAMALVGCGPKAVEEGVQDPTGEGIGAVAPAGDGAVPDAAAVDPGAAVGDGDTAVAGGEAVGGEAGADAAGAAPESIRTPTADGGVELTADVLGLQFYPGAEVVDRYQTKTGPAREQIVELTTGDNPDQVKAFYEQTGGGLTEETGGDAGTIVLSHSQESDSRSVTITVKDGLTAITLNHSFSW